MVLSLLDVVAPAKHSTAAGTCKHVGMPCLQRNDKKNSKQDAKLQRSAQNDIRANHSPPGQTLGTHNGQGAITAGLAQSKVRELANKSVASAACSSRAQADWIITFFCIFCRASGQKKIKISDSDQGLGKIRDSDVLAVTTRLLQYLSAAALHLWA